MAISFVLEFKNAEEDKLKNSDFVIHRIIKGREELSSLYSYEIWGEPSGNPNAEKINECLEKRITLTVKSDDKVVQTIHGIIMSVEVCPNQTDGMSSLGVKWTIRPAFARACYSRSRRVWQHSDVEDGKAFLKSLGKRWDTDVYLTKAAENAIPDNLLQLIQNDESDYNFFARLLSTWGLGYAWMMGGGDAQEEQEEQEEQKEIMLIFDASCADTIELPKQDDGSNEAEEEADKQNDQNDSGEEKAPRIMSFSKNSKFLWKRNYGSQNVTNISNQADDTICLFNNHREQYSKPDAHSDRFINRYKSSHDNGLPCRGFYQITSGNGEVENAAKIAPGKKIAWNTQDGSLCDPSCPFIITGLTINAASEEWKVDIEGHSPSDGLGIGAFPQQVCVNDDPDSDQSDLIVSTDDPSESSYRFFYVRVTDSCIPNKNDTSNGVNLFGRNLCKAIEIEKPTYDKEPNDKKTMEMWVELTSPHADDNSGIFVRPRVGNILFCIQEGTDIPIALGAMFLGENHTPHSMLKRMNRMTRKEEKGKETLRDVSALTLRSRVHVPERFYTKENDGAGVTMPEKDREISDDEGLKITRPMSVHDLAKNPYHFNQIQLASTDNGVRPIVQNVKLTSDLYFSGGLAETLVGFATETNLSASYTCNNSAQVIQNELNHPVTRPHFEGINMYSASDVLMQSADHQIINAGGEIVLTAAQGITLRVGNSFIKITEAGIEINNSTGYTYNPGAYPAYHPSTSAQESHVMGGVVPLQGRIWVDNSGVNMRGPYISSTALTMVSASTFLGSSMTLSDFKAEIHAPATSITGGSALYDTVRTGLNAAALAADITSASYGNQGLLYDGPLIDGVVKYNTTTVDDASGSAAAAVSEAIGFFAGGANFLDNIKSLVSKTSSFIELNANSMVVQAPKIEEYTTELHRQYGNKTVGQLTGWDKWHNGCQFASMIGDMLTMGSDLSTIWAPHTDIKWKEGDTYTVETPEIFPQPAAEKSSELKYDKNWKGGGLMIIAAALLAADLIMYFTWKAARQYIRKLYNFKEEESTENNQPISKISTLGSVDYYVNDDFFLTAGCSNFTMQYDDAQNKAVTKIHADIFCLTAYDCAAIYNGYRNKETLDDGILIEENCVIVTSKEKVHISTHCNSGSLEVYSAQQKIEGTSISVKGDLIDVEGTITTK